MFLKLFSDNTTLHSAFFIIPSILEIGALYSIGTYVHPNFNTANKFINLSKEFPPIIAIFSFSFILYFSLK